MAFRTPQLLDNHGNAYVSKQIDGKRWRLKMGRTGPSADAAYKRFCADYEANRVDWTNTDFYVSVPSRAKTKKPTNSRGKTKKPTSAELRYGSVTVVDLRRFVTILSESAEDLTRVADEMAGIGFDPLPIDGARKFARGQKLLAEFVGHLEVSLAMARANVRAARQAADAVPDQEK